PGGGDVGHRLHARPAAASALRRATQRASPAAALLRTLDRTGARPGEHVLPAAARRVLRQVAAETPARLSLGLHEAIPRGELVAQVVAEHVASLCCGSARHASLLERAARDPPPDVHRGLLADGLRGLLEPTGPAPGAEILVGALRAPRERALDALAGRQPGRRTGGEVGRRPFPDALGNFLQA